MDNISSYLKKFTSILSSEAAIRGVVQEVIQKEVGVEVPRRNITLKQGVLYLKVSPVVKSEVFIGKQRILDMLVKKTGQAIKDIR